MFQMIFNLGQVDRWIIYLQPIYYIKSTTNYAKF